MKINGDYSGRAWAEINLDNLVFNVRQIRKLVGNKVKIMAVVKCDGYGTGLPGIIGTLINEGVDMLGVAFLDEALAIRKVDKRIPVLILGYTPFKYFNLLIKNDISQTVYSEQQALRLSEAALKEGRKARIHIEIDTGMGRPGFLPLPRDIDAIEAIAAMPDLILEGIFTHCPYTNERSKAGRNFTMKQYHEFIHVIKVLQTRGILFPLKHMCNSQGIIYYPDMHLDMVRAGIILYGSYPHFQKGLFLKPVLTLKTRVGAIKDLPPGSNIGYGRTFVTNRETRVATLPLGYGDGFNRLLSNKAHVLIKGQRAPVIGTICMSQCMVDITDVKGKVEVEEEVVIIGKQGKEEITIEELAINICGFVNYEYMVLINRGIPRVYIRRPGAGKEANSITGDYPGCGG